MKQMDYVKKLFKINLALSQEKDMFVLLDKIVLLARDFTNADAGTLYLKYGNNLSFKVVQTETLNVFIGGANKQIDWPPVNLYKKDNSENLANVSAVAALTGEVIIIDDCYNELNYDFSGTKVFDKLNNYRTKSMIVIPLKDFYGDVIGVLQLINKIDKSDNKVISFGDFDKESSVALASQATSAILNVKLVNELENFLEVFMQSIGNAIDKKSPYTGNHVKKVGEFVKRIVEGINKNEDIFKDVTYNKDKVRLMEIASWLHDVGKISVPDHVMDKATKLETVFDGINLIKERFEIVKRDYKIEFLEQKIGKVEFEKKVEDANSDFQFLKLINSGDVYMSPDKLERIRIISSKKYDFNGEFVSILRLSDIKNLSILKGTLTEKERDIIMSHATMTSEILKNIPFPKKFEEAKDIASNHHEKINGKGYPRGLKGDDLSLDDRILAVADVFEALSSGDRPYKKSKKLSEIFKILSFMVKDGDIDGDVVRFIFDSKIYVEYAKDEMSEEQIDEPKLFF